MIKHDLAKHEYFIDPVNSQNNERVIELRLAINWYEKLIEQGKKDNILEVGNVLQFYGHVEHKCVDLFAEYPDISAGGEVENVDAREVDYTGKDVMCVSTIEHIDLAGEYEVKEGDGSGAITVLNKIVNESDSYFITWGPNANKKLDDYVKANLANYDWHGWVRTGEEAFDYTAQDMEVWEKMVDDPYKFCNGIILLQKTPV